MRGMTRAKPRVIHQPNYRVDTQEGKCTLTNSPESGINEGRDARMMALAVLLDAWTDGSIGFVRYLLKYIVHYSFSHA